MNIAVNTRVLLKDRLEGIGYFVQETCLRLATQHPEHHFYFLFDRPYEGPVDFGANVTLLVVPPPTRHPLLWRFWFNWKLPALLRRLKADVFLSPDNFASLRTRVPQCLVVHDLGFLHQPEAYKRSHLSFLRSQLPRFIAKAARIAAVSEHTALDIQNQYGTTKEKIDLVYSAAKPSFKPLPPAEHQDVKDRYTEGKEFFLYAGAIQPRKNLVNLLKAFSLFKKRQRSNWKLVLAGRLAWKNDAFLALLKTYKFRDDVVLTGYLPEVELARLMGAGYALVYPSLFEGFGVPVLEAMNCAVPVLTSSNTSMEEIGGDAALYFNAEEPADMAEKMMMIYKDEPLRDRLVAAGLERTKHFSWDRTASLLWDSIMKAAGKGVEGG